MTFSQTFPRHWTKSDREREYDEKEVENMYRQILEQAKVDAYLVTDPMNMRYISGFRDTDVDTLIMGCTHFPMIEDTIQRIAGEHIKLVNPASETARSTSEMLEEKDILNDTDISLDEEAYRFFVSDSPERFKKIANIFLPQSVSNARQTDVERF